MASLLNNASLLLNPAGSVIAYEEDKIFSVLPTNGTGDFTFTGGDGGTRVNQQGYIEVTPANLMTYSEVFTNGIWQYGSVTATDNQVIAPNGTQTGALMTISTGGHYFRQNVTVVPGSVYTLSFYAKRGTASDLAYSIYDLTNAANIIAATSYYSQTNSSEWSRISVTFTTPAGCISAGCYPTRDGGATGTFYLWGAMVNIGSTALPYQPTTDRLNYPRITYQNGRGALLSEPQRTNLVLYSQQFDVSGWVNYNGGTVTPSASISPDGTQNAYALNVATTTFSGLYRSVSGGTAISTVSGFFKKGTLDWVYLFNSNGSAVVAYFNLANGTIGTVSGGYTANIKPFRDGWYRCSVTNPSLAIGIWEVGGATSDNNPTPAYAGNIYIWGGQNEAGEFPTTYIPTTSATVTRPADVSYVNGISSIIGQTQGVLYAQVTPSQLVDGSYICISDNSTTNRLIFGFESGTQALRWYTPYGNGSGGTVVAGQQCKIAAAYNVNDLSIYLNGIQVANATSGQLSGTYSHLGLDSYTATAQTFRGTVNNVALFNTRLTNTQLQELTTVNSGSGGNISYYGPYTVHTFTGSGTFTPSFNGEVEVLVVAGGGGGGFDFGGGGGAGGAVYASSVGVAQGTGITVTIGGGGVGGPPAGQSTSGGNSVFSGLTAIGGGGGANGSGAYIYGPVKNGGSGGGAGGWVSPLRTVSGSGILGQGSDGGIGDPSTTSGGAGGGGGAGQKGQNASGATAGDGGDGLPYSITGFSTYYAGGGGGGTYPNPPGGTGGLGGGGNGTGGNSVDGFAATANTGGGGGGNSGGGAGSGGNGGSGIVIVRYLT